MSIDELIKQLAAAIEKADQSDLMDGGRYFVEHLTDLTRCRHGETGEYLREADGQLVELLWNNRHTFLNTLRLVARLVEAAEEALSVVGTVNRGHAHRASNKHGGGGYLQTQEWCDWALDDVSPRLKAALAPFQQEAK